MIAYKTKRGDMMSEEKSRAKELDDFWDLSDIVPIRRQINTSSRNISTVDIVDGSDEQSDNDTKLTMSDTVIRRFIPPHSSDEQRSELQKICSYSPENSLIHKVTLYKRPTTYLFYEDFCNTARKLWNVHGEECDYVDYFSYSPQYDQLSSSQLSYYLWWRENIRSGLYISTNTCYIYLYTFELINTDGFISPYETREIMINILEQYKDVLKGVASRYIKWICDYSLIHKLPPPTSFSLQLLKNAGALKEYFVNVPGNTPDGWAKTLLDYCCSYDYRTSKFAKGEDLELYDVHVVGALTKAVEFLSKNGRILSEIPFGDCKLSTKAYEGAICSSENRYTIEVDYCSFSRSHELRFLVGDIVKYAENKIRAHILVKSRLTVYSLSVELRNVIDQYFAFALPGTRKRPKKAEPKIYDVLYDLPRTKLNIDNAEIIEQESWDTTRALVEDIAEDQDIEEDMTVLRAEHQLLEKEICNATEDSMSLSSRLGKYYAVVKALSNNDLSALRNMAHTLGKSTDAIVDSINEIAVDMIGDILIDGSDGDFFVVDDYRELLD